MLQKASVELKRVSFTHHTSNYGINCFIQMSCSIWLSQLNRWYFVLDLRVGRSHSERFSDWCLEEPFKSCSFQRSANIIYFMFWQKKGTYLLINTLQRCRIVAPPRPAPAFLFQTFIIWPRSCLRIRPVFCWFSKRSQTPVLWQWIIQVTTEAVYLHKQIGCDDGWVRTSRCDERRNLQGSCK